MNINSRTSKINFTGFASGAIASFTELREAPIKVVAQIVPIQSGSGDPAPDNIRPIIGVSECNVVACGKNLFDKTTVTLNTRVNTSGTSEYPSVDCSDFIKVPTGDIYISNVCGVSLMAGIYIYNKDKKNVRYESGGTTSLSKKVTIASGECFIRLNIKHEDVDICQVEIGSQATAYEAYNGNTYTIQLGDTCYGGSLDVTTGVLTVTHANIASYNGEPINEPWICSEAVYSEGTTPPIGSQVVYPLATSITVQLTPAQVEQLLGVNNVWADTGNVKVFYVTV